MRNPYRKFYTYLHCKPDGTPFYVGKGYRWRAFRVDIFRNKHHSNVVAKYGLRNVSVYIFKCDSEQQALDDEVRWIAQLRDAGIRLTNQTSGGDGMRNPSQEVRKKLSDLAMGNKWMVGKTIPKEVREKMSLSQKGRPRQKHSEETRAKMSASHMGHPVSIETRTKIAAVHSGKKWNTDRRQRKSEQMKGRVLSTQQKEKIANSMSRYWDRKHNAQSAKVAA